MSQIFSKSSCGLYETASSYLTNFASRLRRALPVTRQKMEWEKVSGYSLGSDLTKARA